MDMKRYTLKKHTCDFDRIYPIGTAFVQMNDNEYVFEKDFPLTFDAKFIENDDRFEKSDERPNITLQSTQNSQRKWT